jgi:hypothetical protein
MHAESSTRDRDAEVDLLRSTEPSASPEGGAPFSERTPTLSSTASESTIIVATQTGSPGEPAPSSGAISVPPARGGGGDHLRKLSRRPHSRSDSMPGEARVTADRVRSGKQDGKHDPEEYAAGSMNQQEYNQLRATGPAVNLSSAAPER